MLIEQQAELDDICAQLASCEILFIDTEFMRERTYFSKLCLLQIAGEATPIYAVDMLCELDFSGLFALINNSRTLKVMHAARQDVEILYQLTGQMPIPLYDTQIAAMFLGLGEQVGYAAMVEHFLAIHISKTQQHTNWEARPLSVLQLEYALSDVLHLRECYRLLRAEIARKKREDWVNEEMQALQSSAWVITPRADLWKRIKRRSDNPHYLARLRAFTIWREDEAISRNLTRNKVMFDDVVQEIALKNPKSIANLQRIKGLNQKINPETLLELLREADLLPISACPTLPNVGARLNDSQELCYDVLRLLRKIIATEESLSANLLCSNEALQDIALGAKVATVINGWRYDMFGRVIQEYLNGKLQIGFIKNKLSLIEHKN